MSVIEGDIRSTPVVLRLTLERIAARGGELAPWLQGPLGLLGCGSSYCIARSAAALYEKARDAPAEGILASECRPRRGWSYLAISRTGKTTELVDAMRRVREAGGRVALLGGEQGAPAEAWADTILPLEFAPEDGIVQTRFISSALLALRLLIGGMNAAGALGELPEGVRRALDDFDPQPLLPFEHVVYLGRGWRYGAAMLAALNLQETALMVPEGHHTLDYRHGPIASAGKNTLIWCLDASDDAQSAAVLDDARRAGATVRCTGDDAQVGMIQSQLLAVRRAESRGVDPDAPRNLSRAIVLPNT